MQEVKTYNRLVDDMKTSMKSGDKVRLSVIRGLIAQIKDSSINAGVEMTEDLVMKTINKAIKQRKDSIDCFINGGRNDLAENEQRELDYLLAYKPAQLSKEDTEVLVKKIITDRGLKTKREMGILMKELKTSEVAQSLDMALVSKIAGTILV